MPHITLEYSDNIQIAEEKITGMFQQIHSVLSEIADINRCKSRAYKVSQYFIGSGEVKSALVYVQIAMLKSPARTEEVKQQVLEKIMSILNQLFLPVCAEAGLKCQPAAEIRDLGSYLA